GRTRLKDGVVSDSLKFSLKQRGRAGDVLIDGEPAVGAGFPAAESLHAARAGMDERHGDSGLRLSGGGIYDCAVDGGKETGNRRTETGEEDSGSHDIAFPHSPQNFMGLANLAPQLGHTKPECGLGSGAAAAAAATGGFSTCSICAITPASSF